MQTTYEPPTFIPPAEPTKSTSLADLVARLPKHIDVKSTADTVVVREDWFQWQYALQALLLTAIGTCVFLAYKSSNTDLLSYIRTADSLELCIAGAPALISVVWAYWTLAGLVNSTTIIVNPERLIRKVGPLPWLGSFSVKRSEIYQLFAEHITRSKRRRTFWDWDGDDTTDRSSVLSAFAYNKKVSYYKLVLRMKDRKTNYTVSNEYRATFVPHMLECILECILGIADTRVAGEAANSVDFATRFEVHQESESTATQMGAVDSIRNLLLLALVFDDHRDNKVV